MAGTIDVQRIINMRKARFSWREVSDAIGGKYNTMYTWLYKNRPDILGLEVKKMERNDDLFHVEDETNWLIDYGRVNNW